MRILNRRSVLNLVCRLHRKSLRVVISKCQQTKLMVQKSIKEEMCLELGSHNVSVYAVWEFHVPSAWPTLLRMKLMIFVLRNTIRPHVNPKN